MTVDEAMHALNYTMRSSVMHALKFGQLRADENGVIDDESVARLVARLEANRPLRELFLKDILTPEEQAQLTAKNPRSKGKR